MRRRAFLQAVAGMCAIVRNSDIPACGQGRTTSNRWMDKKWKIDSRCVLPRGPKGDFDSQVVGDPCIVWDDEVGTWRMFYFASSYGDRGATIALAAGMALSKSAEDIQPGEWRKVGQVPLTNPEDLYEGRPGHKWWVVMNGRVCNRAARINGRYWALFVSTGPKVIEVASATRLAGPWTLAREPILIPGTESTAPDGKHCDTPTAYWFDDLGKVLIFYKAYPLHSQPLQPGSPFGSSSVVAWWHPGERRAQKGRQILIPGSGGAWNRGWIGGVQLLHDGKTGGWYALMNGSPTPPEDKSNREPAPSLGGWAICDDRMPDRGWRVDTKHSPLLRPDSLSPEELSAGLGVNFWRHHLLLARGGQARIFFNSGKYGTEQMYSLVPTV